MPLTRVHQCSQGMVFILFWLQCIQECLLLKRFVVEYWVWCCWEFKDLQCPFNQSFNVVKDTRFLTAVTESCIALTVLQQCHEMSYTGIYKISQHHTMKPESQVMNGQLQGPEICYPIMTQCAKIQLDPAGNCYLIASICSIPHMELFDQSYFTVKLQQTSVTNKCKNKSKLFRRSCQLLKHSYAKAHLEFAQP